MDEDSFVEISTDDSYLEKVRFSYFGLLERVADRTQGISTRAGRTRNLGADYRSPVACGLRLSFCAENLLRAGRFVVRHAG